MKPTTNTVLLRASNISKAYAGVEALKDASFELRAGEVHAVVGENGAGKSTLIKIITGAIAADGGELTFNGEKLTHHSPRVAKSLGITAIYQEPSLFSELSVAENIAIGLEHGRLWRLIDWKQRRRRAADLLQHVGARIDTEVPAGELTMPQQQLVEIARALGSEAKLLIMDEPTAALTEDDAQNLFRVTRDLRARGVGIIYISHRLEELPEIADRVTVLRDGRTIETRPVSEVTQQELIHLMVGRELSSVFPKRTVEVGEVRLELRHFGCSGTGVRDVNLYCRSGEILGLAGLVGAGRTELARTIFGLTPADQGEIRLRGTRIRVDSAAQAIKHGIAYLPEDRRRHGVIQEMALSANITLASLLQVSRSGRLDFRREREIAAEYTRRLGIKAPAIFAPVTTLSGGNQQRVALGRWLMCRPSVLILDEPTQGIDIAAKAEIHALMAELTEQGMAILMISSDLTEILALSDRIAVMHSGTIAAVVDRADAMPHEILRLALGGHDRSNSRARGQAETIR